ncbi:microsomal glutathione S-transferase 1-like [Aricia agestis]|uniref:microsomal glutathione S-transferase 1-like n=1 Tax=Aricia agestis TaxID=91739 RepID=UPI001C20278D|nr:microsomal glutathione S-transferase 1-like [Aricia agestis]
MIEITLQNPIVQSYIIHVTILTAKLLLMATLTTTIRMTKGVFQNPEDAKLFRGEVKYDDTTVERVRRAHLNDLENIPAFWLLGALYITTGPWDTWAILLFRIFTVSRLVHTFVYAICPMPQPIRAIAYAIPFIIMLYMAVQIALFYITAI